MGIEQDRVISGVVVRDDEVVDRAVRPKTLADYVGQPNVTNQMDIFIQAARMRGEALDHVLIFGPPGLGKTTLAHIIANELKVNLRQTSGPVLERPGDLAALLTNLEPRDVLFVDEIHRLSPVVEEVLYPAMEDSQLDLMIGEGPGARSIKLDLPPFTLVGATTRAGLLTSPLRDRFGIVQRLEFYTTEELTKIVNRSAAILKLKLQADGAERIAERSRGTPRIANRLLRRVRDFAEVKASGVMSGTVAQAALDMLEVDPQGFDMLDRKLLLTVIEKFEGGPVGVDSLAAAMSEERGTIEDVIEPFLIQQGFLMRTARGRVATRNAYAHFGLSRPGHRTGLESAAFPGRSIVASAPRFECMFRCYWEDTDAGGVVYYANYLKFLERCRSDWLRALDVDQVKLRAERGLQFVVVNLTVNYLRPAVLDDEILVTAELGELTGATILFKQSIWRGTTQLIDANVRAACLDSGTLKPRPIPKELFMEWRNAQ